MALSHRRFLFIFALAVGFLPAQSPAQIKSNFSSSITSESMAAVWIAKDRGLFKKYGLEVLYILMPRSPLAVSAVIAGEIRWTYAELASRAAVLAASAMLRAIPPNITRTSSARSSSASASGWTDSSSTIT